MAAVEDSPVIDTAGCPRGLSIKEQLAWGSLARHPLESNQWKVDEKLTEAVRFECDNSVEEIDAFREKVVSRWVARAISLEGERESLLRERGFSSCRLRARIHFPLVASLLHETEYEDTQLFEDMLQGFTLVGLLPPCLVEASETPKPQKVEPVETLFQDRKEANMELLSKLVQSEHCGDLEDIYGNDVELGAMGPCAVVTDELLESVTLSRRIAVRELRSAGWRTRAVDDMTESRPNLCAEQSDTQVNGTILQLVFMLLLFLEKDLSPEMWKRDIKSAFRRLPVHSDHIQFAWVVWLAAGLLRAAPHWGMPFGAAASVVAWHRVGAFFSALLLRVALAPVARYVDDYFGASRSGVLWSGGKIMSVLAALTGIVTDPGKDVDGAIEMIVLGMAVRLARASAKVVVHIAKEKAEQWLSDLVSATGGGRMWPAVAAKMAGRLQWALCSSRSKAGRSYIKALFAQANAPMPGYAMSPRLDQAVKWIVQYLCLRPEAVYTRLKEDRPHVRTWSDASGVDAIVCVVVLSEKSWRYTVLPIGRELIETFLPRQDNYIGLLELIAPLLALGTWPELFRNVLWTAFIDNSGALHALVKGTSMSPEANELVGRMWLSLCDAQVSLFCQRVESKSNVADGPTRHDFSQVQSLGAVFQEPRLPDFVHKVWH